MPASEVTICIPAYQAEPFIDRTLWCARRQTHRAIRILVSVDRSEDATERICREHSAADERVVVVSHSERLGWAANSNALLERVQSEFFFLYFHDDVIEPEYTGVLLQAFEERPDAVSTHCDMDRFGALTGVVPAITFDGSDTRRLLTFLVAPTSGPMLRSLTRRRVLDAGLRFPAIGKPGVWQVEPYKMALIAAGPAIGVPRALYRRWHREGSLTADWVSGPLDPVIEGQRLQCAIALDLIAALDASSPEKEVLRFCLYLQTMRYVRRQELRSPEAQPTSPQVLSGAFTGEAPAEALAGLEPDLRRQVEKAHAQLLFLEGRQSIGRGDADTAEQRLAEALRLDPAHGRAAALLTSVRSGTGRQEGPR